MGEAAKKLHPVPHLAPTAVAIARPSLISPYVDLLMIGGGSILMLALIHVLLKPEAPDGNITWTVYYLSFVANFPHFLASYQLLYADFGSRIFKDFKFFWASVLAPAILIGLLLTGFFLPEPKLLGYMVNAMYFFVGWHYVKQIFGGVVVSNALAGFFYNKVERFSLKANLFSLWAISFLSPNIYFNNFMQDGIAYSSLNIPPWTLKVAFWSAGITLAALIFVHVLKYIREGRVPTRMAVVCFASIYAWYIPAFSHPMYMHMIPFFHSMQYILFVYVFRRNKVEANLEKSDTPVVRKKRVLGLWGYFCIPFITGGVFMYFLPRWLDSQNLYTNTLMFGPTAFYFAFTLFINVHHYFIDNVLWRGNNDQMREYLFKRPKPAAN